MGISIGSFGEAPAQLCGNELKSIESIVLLQSERLDLAL